MVAISTASPLRHRICCRNVCISADFSDSGHVECACSQSGNRFQRAEAACRGRLPARFEHMGGSSLQRQPGCRCVVSAATATGYADRTGVANSDGGDGASIGADAPREFGGLRWGIHDIHAFTGMYRPGRLPTWVGGQIRNRSYTSATPHITGYQDEYTGK